MTQPSNGPSRTSAARNEPESATGEPRRRRRQAEPGAVAQPAHRAQEGHRPALPGAARHHDGVGRWRVGGVIPEEAEASNLAARRAQGVEDAGVRDTRSGGRPGGRQLRRDEGEAHARVAERSRRSREVPPGHVVLAASPSMRQRDTES